MKVDVFIVRVAFVGMLVVFGYLLNPFEHTRRFGLGQIGDESTSRLFSAALGALLGLLIIAFEMRVRQASLKTLIGAAVGSILGIAGAFLIGVLISIQKEAAVSAEMQTFLTISLAFFMGYVGLMVGAAKGDYLDLSALGGIFSDKNGQARLQDPRHVGDHRRTHCRRRGDGISGRHADHPAILFSPSCSRSPIRPIRRNGNADGAGWICSSGCSNNSKLDIQIVETDFPAVKEVDLKLIELGKQLDAVIVTNDFNLNKVSQLRGVEVLNINELANALKPVVLPGEAMRVFILKEGKEYNQGVAYLDDGTMVVVDNARRLIGKTADIAVTSVLQTTAGKNDDLWPALGR